MSRYLNLECEKCERVFTLHEDENNGKCPKCGEDFNSLALVRKKYREYHRARTSEPKSVRTNTKE